MVANYNNETDDAAVRMIEDSCAVGMINRADRSSVDASWNRCNSAQFHIEFSDLSYSVPRGKGKRKEILRGIYGCFRPGRLTVIIGPSGAGKTSLLSIVCGLRSSNVKGLITANGDAINKERIRKEICYIPQEFELLPLLTTRETLYVAACLKLGRGPNAENPRLIVTEVAEGLGLSECLDTMVGNLSGGERKRLSIGVEIVTKPSIMLLDEPTSGLDSAASNQVIKLLHSMARAGCTAVCAVHQPSSQMISQFDDVIVLNQGRSMYCGPCDEMLSTFGDAGYICPQFYNIAEFVLEVITEQRGGDLEVLHNISYEKYTNSALQRKCSKNGIKSSNGTLEYFQKEDSDDGFSEQWQKLSCWEQQKVLMLRALLCIKRDITMTKLRLAAHVIVAGLLGAVFYNFGNDALKVTSNIACIFFFLLFLFFANSMPAVQIFPTETKVFLREHLNNWYCLSSYYIVKVVSDLPLQLLCPTLFVAITYYMTGQPMESRTFLQTWGVCVLITMLGQAVGIATGAAFNTQVGTFLIPALSIPMLLFAGFFLKLQEISVYFQPLCTISFFRYAFEGAMQAIYNPNRPNLDCTEIYCLLSSPKKILTLMDMPTVSIYMIITILISWILCLHIIVYVILRWKLYAAMK